MASTAHPSIAAGAHGLPTFPLPTMPCLRRDAVILAPPGQPLRLALSSRRLVSIMDAPDGLADWIAGLDGSLLVEDAVAAAPVPADQARYVLRELDRAGLLLEANEGLPFHCADHEDRDALRLAAEVRDGALRPGRRPTGELIVGVRGRSPLASLLATTLQASGAGLTSGPPSRCDLLVVIGAPFDTTALDACDRAMALRLPHIKMEISAVDATLGPLTLPGETACARCCTAYRGEALSDWSAWSFNGRTPQGPRLPPHHRALVMALAMEHLLVAADCLRGTLARGCADRERHIDLRRTEVSVRSVPPHPACGCIRRAA